LGIRQAAFDPLTKSPEGENAIMLALRQACGALAFLVGFGLRAGAITRHWTLPGFRGGA
jgi:hypothetical protein